MVFLSTSSHWLWKFSSGSSWLVAARSRRHLLSISAWFFLDKEQTIKSNLKRVWIMERELLFWSLTLMAFYLMLDRACIDAKLMIKSIAPLSMSLWWYATAYAIFLALLPFYPKD